MAQLENGYSVSETDEERTNLHDPELISLRSNLTGPKPGSPGHARSSDRYDNMSPFFPQFHHQHKISGVSDGLEHHIRNHDQQLALYQEIASQKIKYFKKIAHLEKLIEQVKGEKS